MDTHELKGNVNQKSEQLGIYSLSECLDKELLFLVLFT